MYNTKLVLTRFQRIQIMVWHGFVVVVDRRGGK